MKAEKKMLKMLVSEVKAFVFFRHKEGNFSTLTSVVVTVEYIH